MGLSGTDLEMLECCYIKDRMTFQKSAPQARKIEHLHLLNADFSQEIEQLIVTPHDPPPQFYQAMALTPPPSCTQ